MDEQKKGIILNFIINELIEQAKNPVRDNPQQKSVINISDIILEMETKTRDLFKNRS